MATVTAIGNELNRNNTASSSHPTVVTTADVAVGDVVVFVLSKAVDTSPYNPISSITDGLGNVYTRAATSGSANFRTLEIWSCPVTTFIPAGTSIIATIPSVTNYWITQGYRLHPSPGKVIQPSISALSPGNQTTVNLSISPVNVGDVMIGVAGNQNQAAITADSDWTTDQTTNINNATSIFTVSQIANRIATLTSETWDIVFGGSAYVNNNALVAVFKELSLSSGKFLQLF